MTDSNNWYIEHFERTGSAIGYRITGKLDEVQSPFQKIEIFQTTDWGNLMTIDGAIMLTSKDNFFYHEMISHPVLFTHAAPKRVVIIGGGDCGTLREVLKHKGVESVTQCDIDEQVTVMARKHFPELCDSNDDARAELLFDDGVAYMANCPAGSVDVVIVDSTEPFGPAKELFGPAFYKNVKRILTEDGIVASQAGSPFYEIATIQNLFRITKQIFSIVEVCLFNNLTYPGGLWAFMFATNGLHPIRDFVPARVKASKLKLNWYNAEIHAGSFALPNFLKKAIGR